MISPLDLVFHEAQRHLKESDVALSYLDSRGVTTEQIEAFKIGYFPDDVWPPYFKPDASNLELTHYLDKSKKGYLLRGKLLFPLTNPMGIIKGLQTRSPLPNKKDYWKFHSVSSDEDAIFFGTHQAMPSIWEKKSIVLVEGIFDLFPVKDVFPNTVCLVTSALTSNQIIFLKRYVQDVFFMVDNDQQGEAVFQKFCQNYSKDFDRIVNIPYYGKDPSEALDKLGAEGFKNLLANYNQ